MTACVIPRCVVRGQHLQLPPALVEHADRCKSGCNEQHHPADCPGCLPTDAEHGLICGGHSRRLRDHLGAREGLRLHRAACTARDDRASCECPEAPHGIAWAWSALTSAHPIVASSAAGDGRSARTVGDPEAERLSAVLALRTEIRDTLGSWCADVADRTGLVGPAGVTVSTSAPPAATGDHGLGGSADRRIVNRCEDWLLRQIAAVEGHESVADLYAELADLMSRSHALAPWRPAPTRVSGIPCRCMATALYDHGDEIKCWACGSSYTHEEYERLCKVLAARYGATA